MLIRLFRWFLGYVKFRYSGGFKEDFINDCYNSGVDLKNICLNGDDLTADTRIKTYKLLHRIAFSHGGTVKIYKKRVFRSFFLRFITDGAFLLELFILFSSYPLWAALYGILR